MVAGRREDVLREFLNGYLGKNKDLPKIDGCELGTLKDVNLCNFVRLDIKSRFMCDLILHATGIHGLDGIYVSEASVAFDSTSKELSVMLEVRSTKLVVDMDFIPTNIECNSWTDPVYKYFINACSHTQVVVGEQNEIVIRISLVHDQATTTTEISIDNLEMGGLTITCLQTQSSWLSYLPDSFWSVMDKAMNKLVNTVVVFALEEGLAQKFPSMKLVSV